MADADAARLIIAAGNGNGATYGALEFIYLPDSDVLHRDPWQLRFSLMRLTKNGRVARKGYTVYGVSPQHCIREATKVVEKHDDEIRAAQAAHKERWNG